MTHFRNRIITKKNLNIYIKYLQYLLYMLKTNSLQLIVSLKYITIKSMNFLLS